jgi:tetratricopeptide (TPR) repeat protein
VHWSRGELAEALACYGEQEAIARELGDRKSMASAVGNRGIVHLDRGEHAEALACFGEQEAIARELGDRMSIATAVGNRSIVHSIRGEYAEALACLAESEKISRQLGDLPGIGTMVGNRGIVHTNRGEYAEALACYGEQEAISRELGSREGIAMALGNHAKVHWKRGEYAEALACYHQADTESRAINFSHGRTYWRAGIARVLLECIPPGETMEEMPEFLAPYLPDATSRDWRAQCLQASREAATECFSISQELSKPDTLFDAQVLLGQIEAAEGNIERAITRFNELLAEADDAEQRADMHYWLWKFNATDLDHRSEALEQFQAFYSKAPKYDYKQLIEELQAGGEAS